MNSQLSLGFAFASGPHLVRVPRALQEIGGDQRDENTALLDLPLNLRQPLITNRNRVLHLIIKEVDALESQLDDQLMHEGVRNGGAADEDLRSPPSRPPKISDSI